MYNNSSGVEDELERMKWLYRYYIYPCIAGIGVCGNILCLVVLVHNRLRRLPSSLYLIGLTLCETIHLITLFWYYNQIPGIKVPIIENLDEFIVSVTGYLTSWFVTALTAERFYAVVYPFKHLRIYTMRTTIFVCVVLTVFALLLSLDVLLINRSVRDGATWGKTLNVFRWIIMRMITLLLILVLNIVIIYKMKKHRMFQKKHSFQDLTMLNIDQVTRMLVTVCLVYTVFSAPLTLLRIYLYLASVSITLIQAVQFFNLQYIFYST